MDRLHQLDDTGIVGSVEVNKSDYPDLIKVLETKPNLPMKPHQFRELVNELRDNALKFHSYQSLRELIIGVLNDNGIYPDHGVK